MAQLSDDCFAFGGELMRADEALAILAARVSCVAGTEEVALRLARERILAEDVAAPRDVPPHDNAAVDGYAVAFTDLAAEGATRLHVSARVAAGQALPGAAEPGAAVRIFTGAPMPAGTDTVFMQEDAREDGDAVVLPPGIRR
ncbi:MAG: molybdopterin molybdenumtransferase MoeA, partial [Alphaproteobacteria bacterium]|nr:molybdopterin molybdenumtransferase MoeA [Alphaproteobacteria bacterium]